MAIELQFQGAALAGLAAVTLRQRLRSTCLPAFPGFSLDHLDVVLAGVSVRSAASGVEIRVPVDVFVVADAALVAGANGVPSGATSPAGRATFTFRVQVTLSQFVTAQGESRTRSLLTLAPIKPDLGPLAAALGANADAVALGLLKGMPAPSLDLSTQLGRLGVTHLVTADVVLTDGVCAIRFGAAGAPAPRLFPGQDWGLFLDGPAVEHLVRSRLEPSIKTRFPAATLSAPYQSIGTLPRVDLAVGQSMSVGAFDAQVTTNLPCDFSLLPGQAPVLRVTVNWSFHLSASLLPGFVESIIEGEVEDAFDPSKFGGTPTGDRAFVIDLPLTPLSLPGVLLRYDTVLGSAAGMTIGGAVVLAGLFEPPFRLGVSKLSGPTRIQICSLLARSGSGAPSKEPPKLENTTSYGRVELDGCGAFCAIELRTPDPSFKQFLSPPPAGSALESMSIPVAIPYSVAATMGGPLSFVVRTPRGVRLVDLGVAPQVETDASGRLLNAIDVYIPDCLTLVPGTGVLVLKSAHVDTSVFQPPPVEHPDWEIYTQQAGGFIVQLAHVSGLAAGELVFFRSATHAVDVFANADGQAVVPMLLPLSAAAAPATLLRANGRSLEGHVDTESALFERRLTLPGALRPGAFLGRSGNALVTTEVHGKSFVSRVTPFGALTSPATHDGVEPAQSARATTDAGLAELNPQPLPPKEAPPTQRELAERAGLHGVARIFTLPGFDAAAVALMANGSSLLLELELDGAVRISGTFTGPIGSVEVLGDWGVAPAKQDSAVYRVSYDRSSRSACGCGRAPRPPKQNAGPFQGRR